MVERHGVQDRYPVVFREPGGTPVAGALELQRDRLLLTGSAGGRDRELAIALADIDEIRVGRRPADRLNGVLTLVLERGDGSEVQVAPLGAGLLGEIADLLTVLTADRARLIDELVVVVPLKPGCRQRAQELLGQGPPLDPAALGLTGHEVYLRDAEAVFVFRGPEVIARIGRAMRSPALWRAGIAWQGCIAGRPRVVEDAELDGTPVYSWTPD